MEEQEIAAAIGWMMVASGALAVMLSSVFPRHVYRATTAGLLLALLGLLIAGHIWAAVVVLMLTLARYGYYLCFLRAPWRKRAQ
jgi:ABC-type Mn2+/Zn2+ transport system permease subunit